MNVHKRLRSLHRTGLISHACWVIAETALWSCRGPDRPEFQVSYDRLAQLAHCARSTVALALRQLRALGVLNWRNTWLWVGGRRVRWRNTYRFSESDGRATDQVQREASKRPTTRKLRRLGPCAPIRTVEEQLRLLGVG